MSITFSFLRRPVADPGRSAASFVFQKISLRVLEPFFQSRNCRFSCRIGCIVASVASIRREAEDDETVIFRHFVFDEFAHFLNPHPVSQSRRRTTRWSQRGICRLVIHRGSSRCLRLFSRVAHLGRSDASGDIQLSCSPHRAGSPMAIPIQLFCVQDSATAIPQRISAQPVSRALRPHQNHSLEPMSFWLPRHIVGSKAGSYPDYACRAYRVRSWLSSVVRAPGNALWFALRPPCIYRGASLRARPCFGFSGPGLAAEPSQGLRGLVHAVSISSSNQGCPAPDCSQTAAKTWFSGREPFAK